jgi:hypothetical protein
MLKIPISDKVNGNLKFEILTGESRWPLGNPLKILQIALISPAMKVTNLEISPFYKHCEIWRLHGKRTSR